jgi:hypothetical protein
LLPTAPIHTGENLAKIPVPRADQEHCRLVAPQLKEIEK